MATKEQPVILTISINSGSYWCLGTKYCYHRPWTPRFWHFWQKGGLWHPGNTKILTRLANESLSTKNEMIFIKMGSCWWLGAKYCQPYPGTPGFWQFGQNNVYGTPGTQWFRRHWQMWLSASKITLILWKRVLVSDRGPNIVVAIHEHNDFNNLGIKFVHGTPGTPWFWQYWQIYLSAPKTTWYL